jgi:FKBP-type peptidyl-prolyl cis-trans isomerase FkpA
MKIYQLILALALLVSCTKEFPRQNVESDLDKSTYVFGTTIGAGLKSLKLSKEQASIVAAGFMDAALGRPTLVVRDRDRDEKIKTYFASRKETVEHQESLSSGKIYLENFLKDGGVKTSSGLAYKILDPGEGVYPGPNSTVDIHYQGILVDGSVFASTMGTRKPARTDLDKIISGWSEGIRLLKPGGHIKLVIPPELGYGDTGVPPKIPPGAYLIFDVGLISIISDKK